MARVVELKLMALPTVRGPPTAKTLPLLAPMVSVPVPMGPEVTTGEPTESIANPMPPSLSDVPPEKVLAAVKIVFPPVPEVVAVRL